MSTSSARNFQEGLAAAHAGDAERALSIAEELLARDPNDVHAFQIIGYAHFCRGQNREAFEAFVRANQLAPNQPAIINWLGVLLSERGDFEQARSACAKAAQLAPRNPEILSNLGEALALLGQRKEAQHIYERAVAIEPPNSLVLARAARFFERNHDVERARAYAERALTLDPTNEVAQIAMAEVESRDRNYDAVIARLGHTITSKSSSVRNQSRMCHLLAEAYDRTGRYDEAFAAYTIANTLQKQMYASRVAEEHSPLTPETLARLIAHFEQEEVSTWTRHDDLAGPTPAFLVGFTRSGTTWLDQILSSHSDIVVLEEKDNLFAAWNDLLLDEAGLRKLGGLSQVEVERYRAAYWRRAESHLQQARRTQLLIDKVPLNTAQLGLIYRLFPKAKIIFAVRDPRDCILSNFQQHFAINAAVYQFLSLESAATYYDQVMTLGRIYRKKLPLDLLEVRYENLVADLEAETRSLLDFLGLDWSEAVLSYDETARKRTVLTASARQVINRPYSSSIGKWRRYEKQMAAVLPTLEKWAAEFGYVVNRV